MFWLRMSEPYLYDQRTKLRLALLAKFLAGNTVLWQLHYLAFDCLRCVNDIVNRLSVMSRRCLHVTMETDAPLLHCNFTA